MLSIVWISSSCTTHLISKAENKRCSWTSAGKAQINFCQITQTQKKTPGLVIEWSARLTGWGPAPGAVLTNAWGWAVLTLPTVLHGEPVGAADGVLVIRAGLNIHWSLGNGVLRATCAELIKKALENVQYFVFSQFNTPRYFNNMWILWKRIC